MFENYNNLDVPLDLFIGLLCEHKQIGEKETGIFELEFVHNYSRVPTTQIDWCSPDEIIMYNACDITFPTVLDRWGEVTHFGLWLSPDGIDCVCIGNLIKPKDINKGSKVNFFPLKIGVEIEILEEAIKEFRREQ